QHLMTFSNARDLASTIDFDASNGRVTRSTLYTGVPVAVPKVEDTDTYAHDELTYGLRRQWRNQAVQYINGTGNYLGSNSLTRGLKFEVPLPGALTGVFGTGANLNVNGSEQVTIGGVSDYSVNQPLAGLRKQSAFPALNMKQDLQVNLGGSIGDKI